MNQPVLGFVFFFFGCFFLLIVPWDEQTTIVHHHLRDATFGNFFQASNMQIEVPKWPAIFEGHPSKTRPKLQ